MGRGWREIIRAVIFLKKQHDLGKAWGSNAVPRMGRGWKENFRAMAFLESGLKTKKV